MKANDVRKTFLDFFESKKHNVVSSASMIIKDDPTLMFVNAGMNQFKEIFLGQTKPQNSRVTNSQKCLRVSGKHNDLEEVGHDTYHHTMFEMLGNWSFGDYFKQEAIDWAWELLTDVYKIPKERLYATVFGGDTTDKIERDNEAAQIWEKHLPKDRIINGSKKDNFWEMGAVGPCGPCSEIHIDLRNDDERKNIDALELINKDHPLVIEIWNLVFMQFNRKDTGELEALPAQHVDTGMGLERLCMVMQNKKSNYDTDVFQPIIQTISSLSDIEYGKNNKTDIAMRVIADHLRAVSFAIADGQLPSNNKAGYVIRRILRRAVRYSYTFLNQHNPFIYKLVDVLESEMGGFYSELSKQKELIKKVIKEEEQSFLSTLENGIKLLDQKTSILKKSNKKSLDGKSAFELYDTYGFPLDLTELILKENNLSVDIEGFNAEMKQQKDRSRSASKVETKDWIELKPEVKTNFTGYDETQNTSSLIKYRKVKTKGNDYYQLVFDRTPFYAESGGQVGDTGYIECEGENISIVDTKKENNLIVHFTKSLPKNTNSEMQLVVNKNNRTSTESNHTATHLTHYALRKVLGTHVEQKGSLVNHERFRFDFSHFEKLTQEQIEKVEDIVNDLIQQNIQLKEHRDTDIEEAKKMGAMALFGEKYGSKVRVIQFGDSIELCGGTHATATGNLGLLIITQESAIASGIRRIEGITGKKALQYVREKQKQITLAGEILKSPKNIIPAIEKLQAENIEMQKQLDNLEKEKALIIKSELLKLKKDVNGINVIASQVNISNAAVIKEICFQLKNEVDNLFLVLGATINNKPSLSIMIAENLVAERKLHAGNIIREAAKEMKGGGGGQPFYATAGGKDINGIENAIKKAISFI